jgi:hypothetical protein
MSMRSTHDRTRCFASRTSRSARWSRPYPRTAKRSHSSIIGTSDTNSSAFPFAPKQRQRSIHRVSFSGTSLRGRPSVGLNRIVMRLGLTTANRMRPGATSPRGRSIRRSRMTPTSSRIRQDLCLRNWGWESGWDWPATIRCNDGDTEGTRTGRRGGSGARRRFRRGGGACAPRSASTTRQTSCRGGFGRHRAPAWWDLGSKSGVYHWGRDCPSVYNRTSTRVY